MILTQHGISSGLHPLRGAQTPALRREAPPFRWTPSSRQMARVLEPAFRVARCHPPDDLPHGVVDPLHRTCSRRAERFFDLAPTVLHRRQVRRVRRQNAVASTSRLNGFTSAARPMRTESVDHNDIVGFQERSYALTHVLGEDLPVHGSFKGQRSDHALQPQSQDERDIRIRLARRLRIRALPPSRPRVAPRHAQMSAELVEEDQPPGAYPPRPSTKGHPTLLHVGPVLLARMKRFFFA
jgi:hypothetical protein